MTIETTPRTQYVREPDEIADMRAKLLVDINVRQTKLEAILSDPWHPKRAYADDIRAELEIKRACAATLLWVLGGD
jgi:hypothetical protein